MNEFFNQGDKERACGLKISPFMDRRQAQIGLCQSGFLDFVAEPLFELVQDYAWRNEDRTDIEMMMQNLRSNRRVWGEVQTAEEMGQRVDWSW